jgi:hypothetical protein
LIVDVLTKAREKKGISPAVAMIDNIPVYLENRNGNSNASFRIVETLKDTLELLKTKGIQINTIRMDCAAYTKQIFALADSLGINVIVRAKSPAVQKEIEAESIKNWREIIVKGKVINIGSTLFRFGQVEYRLVVKKLKTPIVDDDGVETKYWGLATNDFVSSDEAIINTYELRGDSESMFRDLKDFGWKILPMRNLQNNTVYLSMTAINFLIFKFVKKYLANSVKCVNETMQLKTFTKKFMRVATTWIKGQLSFLTRASEFKEISKLLNFDSG